MVSPEIVDDQNKSTKTNAPNAVALIFLGIIIYVYISSIFSIVFWFTKPVVMKVDVFLCVATAMILFLVWSPFALDLDHDSARRLNFTIFSALVPALISTLYFSVSEIDDREYMNLESRIVSAGDDGKMVARSMLKPHKKVNGWEYRAVIKELDEIESNKSKMEDSRRKIQEHENAKSSLFKAIHND